MKAAISKEDFAVLAKDRNLKLTPRQLEEFREVYVHIQRIRERLRAPRGYGAEPASTFKAREI